MNHGASTVHPPRRLNVRWSTWRELRRNAVQAHQRFRWRDSVNYAWSSAWFSLALRLQRTDAVDDRPVAHAEDPLFVLGFWRSGTTLLHEYLCTNAYYGFPSTWQCMDVRRISSAVPPARAVATVRRPMDAMIIQGASPQEDEFALLSLGAVSIYRALLLPTLLRDGRQLLDPCQWTEETVARWCREFHWLVNALNAQQGRPQVLKAPTHTFRVPLLLREFPAARFAHVVRDPAEVWRSNLNMWREMTALYALTALAEPDITSFLCDAYELYVQRTIQLRAQMPRDRYVEVSYEDLVRAPLVELRRIHEQLGLRGFDSVATALPDAIARLRTAGKSAAPGVVGRPPRDRIDAWRRALGAEWQGPIGGSSAQRRRTTLGPG